MKPQHDNASYKRFCETARKALEQEANQLQVHGFEQLASLEAKWHPNGFAVFHLNEDHELGNLRLHIWPDTLRVSRPEGAFVHTHAWNLCSRILAGNYAETLYEEAAPETANAKHYYSAVINYRVDRNSLLDPSTAWLKPTVKIQAAIGDHHEVAAGVPHQTHITARSFTATLLFTSPPVLNTVMVYSPTEIHPNNYQRPVLAEAQKTALLSRLAQESVVKEGVQDS